MADRGFRKFMLDPKSSVMTYIADNMPAEHLSHQQGGNSGLQHGSVHDPNGQQENQLPSQHSQGQSQGGFVRPYLPHRPSQSNSQSSSPLPGYAQPVQSTQLPVNSPYIASNLSQANPGSNGYTAAQSQLPSSQSLSNVSMVQDPLSQKDSQNHDSQTTAALGQGPPQPGARRRNSPQSAPRLYHRMILEFDIMKQAFFLAKSREIAFLHYNGPGALAYNILERSIQEMTSIAYDLESSARRIWGLRYEHSWEFEGYSEVAHQAVFSKWQAEYEMWADTVLDIQDGQVLADAANPIKYGNASMHKDSEDWNSQLRQDQSGDQSLHGETEHQDHFMHQEHIPSGLPQQIYPQQQMILPQQMPPQQQISPPQQIPQLQNLSMSQSTPPFQNFQSSQTSQPMPPGAFPQSGPPGTTSDQGMSLQQRQQSPHPPQMQIPTPSLQNVQYMPPGQFTGSQNMQKAPNGPPSRILQPPNMQDPNMQQPQNTQPRQSPNMQQGQSRPPQQYMQQNQGIPPGSAPYMPQQQNPGVGQQGPPRNGPPLGQTMSQGQNTGARQSSGGSPLPPSLQAGGQVQGNGKQ